MNGNQKQKDFEFYDHQIIAQRYEFVRIVGKGAMGVVIKVLDHMLDDDAVALKLLYPNLLEDRTIYARFRNEVLVARKLAHPNIVRLYDFGRAENDIAYISMEYVEGASLTRVIHSRTIQRLDLGGVCNILLQVAAGLQHAHSEGVVHRDIKPDNVIVGSNGRVKVTDLGLARCLDVDKGYTAPNEAVGTPHYMAPETISGRTLDIRSDIYSFGIMAYEMAAGQRPFDDKSWSKLAEMHLVHKLPKLTGPAKDYPPWFYNMLIIATDKSPGNRFQSFGEIIEYLNICLRPREDETGKVVQPRSLSFRQKLAFNPYWRKLQEWPRTIMAIGIVLALIAGGCLALRCNHQTQRAIYSRLEGLTNNQRFAKAISGYRLPSAWAAAIGYVQAGQNLELRYALAVNRELSGADQEGRTLVHYAALAQRADVVRTLCLAACDFNAVDSSGRRALHYAVENLDNYTVSELVQCGAQLTMPGELLEQSVINSLLHRESSAQSEELFNYLLSKGLDVTIETAHGLTILHYAAERGYSGMVEKLILAGADFNHQDDQGRTPLMLASEGKHSAVIRLLVSAGADLTLRNQRNQSALDLVGKDAALRALLVKQ